MRKIKIAQIGIGHDHAPEIFDSILAQDDIFEVKGFCVCEGEEAQYEAQKEKVYAKSIRLSLEELLNDPQLDAVTVECQEIILTKYAQMAIDHGLHVHMDKPGSADHETFETLMRSAKEKNLTLHLGYMYRYNPAVRHTLELVKSGKLGKIYSVEAHMDCLHNAKKRQWLNTFPGGMLFFLGCHLIDLIVQIQGVPEEIIPLSTCTGFDGVTGQDYGMTVFQYPGGISFAKTCAAEPGGFLRRQLVVCGENGTVEIKPFEKYISPSVPRRTLTTGIKEVSKEEAQKKGWHFDADYREIEPVNRYDNMMAAFAAMVCGEQENPYTYEHEVMLHRILLKSCGVEIDYKNKIRL